MFSHKIALLLLCLGLGSSLWAQQEQEKVVLTDIELEVSGVYNRAALLHFLGLQQGQEFDDLAQLRRQVEREINRLEGKGYYRDLVFDLLPDGQGTYRLRLSMQANWSIYPLPIPVYDSNSGPGFRGRLIWDNFLGSLTRAQLRFDMDEDRGSDRNDWTAGLSFSGLQLSDAVSITFGLAHSYEVEGSRENQLTEGTYGMSFALPRLAEDVSWSYDADLGLGVSYGFRNFSTGAAAGGPGESLALDLGHGPAVSSVRYQDGLKQGFDVGLRNAINTTISKQDKGVDELSLELDFRAYQVYFGMLNFRGRLLLMAARNLLEGGGALSSSDYLRGVSDADARSGTLGVVLNMDALLRVWRNPFLGEIYLEPFLDLAIIGGLSNFGSIEQVLQLSAGLDISWKINSLIMRFSVGKNLTKNEDLEITLGTGLFF